MRFVSVQQMRAADVAAQALPETSGMALMFCAGMEVARVAARVATARATRRVTLVAGHGNNGGDAFVAAEALRASGFSVHVLMTCLPENLRGDARVAFQRMKAADVLFTALPQPEDWSSAGMRARCFLPEGVLVDGVLGTGCNGAPRGTSAAAIRWINAARRCATVVAIDLPSGMNGDSGDVAGDGVVAEVTVTFARPKTCFLNGANAGRVGSLQVADIGMPDAVADAAFVAETGGIAEMIAVPELRRLLPPRPRTANKGTFGKLCIFGGCPAFPHAPVLAALGALKSGVGLLTLAVPEESRAAAAVHVPEAVFRVREEIDFSAFDAVVYGPGRGTPEEGERLSLSARRVVLDADGLNLLARTPGARPCAGEEWILTPHPGEAARLLGCTVAEVQSDRPAAVRALAGRFACVAVLKGAGTLVCRPGGKPWINLTGNPGMASGGTGDVLAGLIGGFWAQGMEAFDAACLGVWAHGTAGDLAALEEGQASLCARSLAIRLPGALEMLR